MALRSTATFGLSFPTRSFNRVLIYENQGGAWNRTKVLGQTDPNSCTANCPAGAGLNQLRSPAHVAVDSSGIVYVADFGNNRVLIYSNSPNLERRLGANYSLSAGLSIRTDSSSTSKPAKSGLQIRITAPWTAFPRWTAS